MKQQMTYLTAVLAWLVSLAGVFVLGVLLSFAFHRGGGDVESSKESTIAEKRMLLALEEIFDGKVEVDAVELSASTVIPGQVDMAIRQLTMEPRTIVRNEWFHSIAMGLPSRQLVLCIDLILSLNPSPGRSAGLSAFLKEWGRRDGRSATSYAVKLGNPFDKRTAILSALRGWAELNFPDAWNWAVTNSSQSSSRLENLSTVLEVLAQSDRELAISTLSESVEGNFQNSLAQRIVGAILSVEHPREAIRWLSSFPANTRPSVATLIAEEWAIEEPNSAMAWMIDNFGYQSVEVEPVVMNWAKVDGFAAAEFIWTQVPDIEKQRFLELIAFDWIDSAGVAPVARWVNERGPNSDLDPLIIELVWKLESFDPESALVWSGTLSDPAIRTEIELRIQEQWFPSLDENNDSSEEDSETVTELGNLPEQG